MSHFRAYLKLLPLPLLASVLTYYCVAHSPRVGAQPVQGSKLRDLQEQRLATLRNLAKITGDRYRSGQASFDELSSATKARDSAELELSTSARQRISILERMLVEAKALEEEQNRLSANRLAPETAFLRAKADRLQQEILLEQARVP